MCWAGKHFEIPTGMKKGDMATAIATRITARAISLVFISAPPFIVGCCLSVKLNEKAASIWKRLN
jgi:hypothetical protein